MNDKVAFDISDLDESGSKIEIPLKSILVKSEQIKRNVKKAADQISSVNAVLKQEENAIPSYPTIEEVITQNEEAEQMVTKAADDLRKVNAELAKQVTERIDIELALKQTKSELFDIRDDLSQSQAREKNAVFTARHDSLTKLPNRLFLAERLDHGLIQSKRHGWQLAILFIDLDKFKSINDTYGHDIGDKVLITVAKRLRACVRGEDTVSRWGGDEFICVLLNIRQDTDVINIANKMVAQISQECNFDGTIISISATIGIALCPRDGETSDILFKQVDRAMYLSKGSNQRVMLFDDSILNIPTS